MKLLKRLFREEEGVTLIEYGLIAGLVAVFLIAALTILGDSLNDIFRRVAQELDDAPRDVGDQ